MKITVTHSIVQDMTVIKFHSIQDYFRCLEFIDNSNLTYVPLTFSSVKDNASIRVSEPVLQIITQKFGVGKNASTNTNCWSSGMWKNHMD